jgi:hypothetical protein
MDGFELTMTIKEGFSSSTLRGSSACPVEALNSYHVETAVEGVHSKENDTSAAKMTNGKAVWNKKIVMTFRTIEAPIPIIISMSMYRTRTFHGGFKLVGTAHFALMDLLKILDKPPVCGKISLNTKKYQMASGHLVVELQLRTIHSSGSPRLIQATPAAHGTPVTPTRVSTTIFAISADTSITNTPTEAVRMTESPPSPSSPNHKQQLYAPDTTGVSPTKTTGGSIFSAWFVVFVVLTLMVTTCSTYQLLV